VTVVAVVVVVVVAAAAVAVAVAVAVEWHWDLVPAMDPHLTAAHNCPAFVAERTDRQTGRARRYGDLGFGQCRTG